MWITVKYSDHACGWRVTHDDSRTREEWRKITDSIHDAWLRCTATMSVPRGFRQISSWSWERTSYLEASLGMRKTRIMRHAQQTCFTQLISPLQPCSPTRRKKQRDQPREDSRTASVSEQGETTSTDIGHEETWLHLSFLCVSSPHCLPINRHITQQVTVVGIIWLSQHRHLNAWRLTSTEAGPASTSSNVKNGVSCCAAQSRVSLDDMTNCLRPCVGVKDCQLRKCSRIDEWSALCGCRGFRFHTQFCLCCVQIPEVWQVCTLSLQRTLSLSCACLPRFKNRLQLLWRLLLGHQLLLEIRHNPFLGSVNQFRSTRRRHYQKKWKKKTFKTSIKTKKFLFEINCINENIEKLRKKKSVEQIQKLSF